EPAMARPDRSPFTSATKQGTPALDRPSMMPWIVTVLPVPVAPAISPCRLARLSTRDCGCAPPVPAPMKMPVSPAIRRLLAWESGIEEKRAFVSPTGLVLVDADRDEAADRAASTKTRPVGLTN